MRVLVLNGPNLNLLGSREPAIYGRRTLEDIEALCRKTAAELDMEISLVQSDHEGELVEAIQEASLERDAIVINAAAYTHTSIAILDALRAFEGIVVEVHLTNPARRESFRRRSLVALRADAVVCGFGSEGYRVALAALRDLTCSD